MKPFESIQVLDLTHVIAGPFCTHQLAMLGAQVIKIESPTLPDMMRESGPDFDLAQQGLGLHFLSQNAGKRSLALDFKHPEGRKVLERLIRQSDVLVENFRGGVMQAMSLGYDQLQVLNPTLIYCSMSGFGHTGPKANHPAYDNVIQAYSGLMMATGSPQAGPFKVGPPVLDYGTGANAALAIAAALFQRQATGKGQHIDVAMLDSALMLMSSSSTETSLKGQSPGLPGNSSSSNAGYGVYQAQEGLIMLGAYTPKQLSAMWSALQQSELAETVKNWTYEQIDAACDEHRSLLSSLMARRAAQDWEDLFIQFGVPAARVRTLDESLHSDQVKSRKVMQEVPDPTRLQKNIKVPVAAFAYSDDGPSAQSPPPTFAQHTEEILTELGLGDDAIVRLAEIGVIRIPNSPD